MPTRFLLRNALKFKLGLLYLNYLVRIQLMPLYYKRILNDIREVYNNVCMFEFEVGTDIKFR